MVSSFSRAVPALVVLALVACGGDDAAPAASDVDGGRAEGGSITGVPNDGATVVPPQPTAGCGMGPAPRTGFLGSQSITVAGTKHTYLLTVPAAYDGTKSYPLVFVLHWDGGTGANIRSSYKLEAASSDGAIFVYPDGSDHTWHIDDSKSFNKDVAFIDAITADVEKTLCADKSRIFAAGMSKGAYFANMLACVSKSGFRAVVAHSGGGPFGVDGSGTSYDNDGKLICPSAPVAAMQIIGSSDDLLGDGKEARDYWRRVDTCKSTTTAYAPSPCVSYDGCASGRPEVYCEIPGLGHAFWTNAASATWDFLKAK